MAGRMAGKAMRIALLAKAESENAAFTRELLTRTMEALKRLDAFESDPSVGIYGDEDILWDYNRLQRAESMDASVSDVCVDCMMVGKHDCVYREPEV